MPTPNLMGWINNPGEAARVTSQLKGKSLTCDMPLDTSKTTVLTDFVKAAGATLPQGPQLIGDCVSWGWGNLTNILQCMEIMSIVKKESAQEFQDLMTGITTAETSQVMQDLKLQYKEIATESIYAYSRVTIGQQHGSMDDGSVGAWAAKAMEQCGVLNRELVGAYSGDRAKQWGANGVPSQFDAIAHRNIIKVTTPVTNFTDAARFIQAGTPVAVCSNRGFTMSRDNQGFCKPSGTWNHCMLFMGCRFDRPGALCMQSWGKNTPNGPVVLAQPDNTFWVDENTVDYMLGQQDSFTGNYFEGYADTFSWEF